MLLVFIPLVDFAQTSYYVDAVNGSDANPGVSQSLAWKTIGKVNRSRFLPGDNILLRSGQTWRENLQVTSSGSAGNPIRIGSYGTGEKPILNGSIVAIGWTLTTGHIYQATFANAPRVVVQDDSLLAYLEWNTNVTTTFSGATAGCFSVDDSNKICYVWATDGANPDTHKMQVSYSVNSLTGIGIYLRDLSYVTVDGLTVCNTAYQGIRVLESTTASNVIIKNCTVFNAGHSGIEIDGPEDATSLAACTFDRDTVYQNRAHGIELLYHVYGSTVSHILSHNNSWNLPLGFHGISSWGPDTIACPTGNTFEYNEVYATYAVPGADYEGTGIQMDNNTRNCIIRYNKSHDNGGAGFYLNSGLGNSLYYNMSYNNGHQGITFTHSTSGSANNNTLYNNSGSGLTVEDSSSNISIINNIMSQNGRWEIDIQGGATSGVISNFNCVYHTAGGNLVRWRYSPSSWTTYKATSHLDFNSINANPLFVSPATHDFHLKSGSPALNAGMNLGYTRDVVGNPVGKSPDLGAYEMLYTSVGGSNLLNPDFRLDQNYPNPFNPTTSIRYEVSKKSWITITLYDVIGRFVKTLVNEELDGGFYLTSLEADKLSSGVYYYRMQANTYVATRSCVLLR